MQTQPWYRSKVIWTFVAMTLVGIFPLVPDLVKGLGFGPQVVQYAQVVVTFALGVLGVIFRVWFTDTTISA